MKNSKSFKKPKRPNWRTKRGTLSDFLTSILLQNIKNEGNPLETLNIFRKKTKNENFEQCHSVEKCKSIWDF